MIPPDLTVLYLTNNRLPSYWTSYHWSVLTESRGNFPIITVGRQVMPEAQAAGEFLLDEDVPGYVNIYRQLLRAAQVATTPYVAVAEDDVLYSPDHFTFHRPQDDRVAYNYSRWALFTWGVPTYSFRYRHSNAAMIAPRPLLVEALTERFTRWPGQTMPHALAGEVGRARVEAGLHVTPRISEVVWSRDPIVQFNHRLAGESSQSRRKKALGGLQCFDIPYWGRADQLVRRMTVPPEGVSRVRI